MRKNEKRKPDTQHFNKEVYSIVAEIPKGNVITYGEIALLTGYPQNSRLVGRALKDIPLDLSVPCHRVVNSQGRLVPGWDEQKELLLKEGVKFKKNGQVDMLRCRWNWREDNTFT